MRKRILMVLMAAVLCFSTCACGSNAGGLGKLEINQKDDDDSKDKKDKKDKKNDDDDDDIPDIGGSTNDDDVPDLGGGSKPEPTPEPQPEPKPANKEITVELYQGDYASMYVPTGWKVYENVFNAGNNTYRMFLVTYNPENPNEKIIFASGMEPFFASQTDYNKMKPFLDIDPVVMDTVDAEGVIRGWNKTYDNLKIQHFDATADLYGTIDIQEVLSKVIGDGATDSIIPSEVLSKVIQPDGNTYNMYYSCVLARTYYAHLGATYYISLGNCAVFCDEEDGLNYLTAIVNGCLGSLDISKLDAKNNKITADEQEYHFTAPNVNYSDN